MGKDEFEAKLRLLAERFANHSPFPRAPDDTEVADLHGDLAEYDFYTAAEISRALEKRKFRRKYDRSPEIGERIQRLLEAKPEHAQTLRAYRRIYSELLAMLDLMQSMRRGE